MNKLLHSKANFLLCFFFFCTAQKKGKTITFERVCLLRKKMFCDDKVFVVFMVNYTLAHIVLGVQNIVQS